MNRKKISKIITIRYEPLFKIQLQFFMKIQKIIAVATTFRYQISIKCIHQKQISKPLLNTGLGCNKER